MSLYSLTGEFASAASERAFLIHQLERTRSMLGFTLLFCVVFFVSFFASDIARLGLHDAVELTLAPRLAVGLTAGSFAWLAYRRRLSVRCTRLAASLSELVALAAFMLIVQSRPNEMQWHAMSMSIMLMVIYLYIPNRLAYALALAIGASAVFIVQVMTLWPTRQADLFTLGMLLVLVNTFGLLAARRYNQVAREEFRLQLDLKYNAERDHLTGCYNRRYLHEHLLGVELARARRCGSLAVVLCDIDHFKRINDSFGHHQGDVVIRSFARLLMDAGRVDVDAVVRYGGEEFLLILPGADLAGGCQLAERLRAVFADSPMTVDESGETLQVTASFGVASADFTRPGSTTTLSDLILAADKRLYDAKRNGRNRVEAIELR